MFGAADFSLQATQPHLENGAIYRPGWPTNLFTWALRLHRLLPGRSSPPCFGSVQWFATLDRCQRFPSAHGARISFPSRPPVLRPWSLVELENADASQSKTITLRFGE